MAPEGYPGWEIIHVWDEGVFGVIYLRLVAAEVAEPMARLNVVLSVPDGGPPD
jgi:hypothetical protein